MQINLDCIKDVLLYLIDNIDYEECGDTWDILPVSLKTLYQADELSKYSKKEIMRSTLDLINCGYIVCLHRSPKDKPYVYLTIAILTHNVYFVKCFLLQLCYKLR
nr:MAG TPA: hypothetical protein [Caudoviricetes sp.]